jgi:PAS domain-containing protein
MSGGAPDPARFKAVITPLIRDGNPDRPIHAFGEMVAVLCERGEYEAALAVEALWNELLTQHTFSLFCGYPLRLFSSAERANGYQHFCACHSEVHVDGSPSLVHDETGGPADTEELRMQVAALRSELRRSRRSEEILRARNHELAEFLDNACEGIHKVAADGTILYANRAELDMLGYRWEE